MARYYFHIHDGIRFAVDEVGLELDNLAAAEHEALHTAAQLGWNRLLKGQLGEVRVEVTDEHNQQGLSATASLRVNRPASPPQPLNPWIA